MPAITVRNLPDETHRALKVRAAQHGRSTEAEVRHILENAVQPKTGMGTLLADIGRSIGGLEMEIRRDRKPVAAAKFK
jgi:antitoxin FitA